MVRKTASEPEAVEVKGKRGYKVCPECGEKNGVRSRSCKKCKNEFRPKAVPTSDTTLLPQFEAAMNFIKACGGIETARKTLEQVAVMYRELDALKCNQ